MSEEIPGNLSIPAADNQQALDQTQRALDKLIGTARVEAAFGPPAQHEDSLIIPAAEAICILGFGLGSGGGNGPTADGKASGGGGGGGAGGGYTRARPVAVVVVSPSGVEIQPVVDVTKIALVFIAAWGTMVVALARMMRKPRR